MQTQLPFQTTSCKNSIHSSYFRTKKQATTDNNMLVLYLNILTIKMLDLYQGDFYLISWVLVFESTIGILFLIFSERKNVDIFREPGDWNAGVVL